MLDLALVCDLDMASPTDRPAIRARHAQIKTQADALVYIRTVEHKVHLRRKTVYFPGRHGATKAAPI